MRKPKAKKIMLMPGMDNDLRKRFIRALAVYLVGDQVKKSIELQMNKESALEWQHLRCATPLFGYPTVEEAIVVLDKFLR